MSIVDCPACPPSSLFLTWHVCSENVQITCVQAHTSCAAPHRCRTEYRFLEYFRIIRIVHSECRLEICRRCYFNSTGCRAAVMWAEFPVSVVTRSMQQTQAPDSGAQLPALCRQQLWQHRHSRCDRDIPQRMIVSWSLWTKLNIYLKVTAEEAHHGVQGGGGPDPGPAEAVRSGQLQGVVVTSRPLRVLWGQVPSQYFMRLFLISGTVSHHTMWCATNGVWQWLLVLLPLLESIKTLLLAFESIRIWRSLKKSVPI